MLKRLAHIPLFLTASAALAAGTIAPTHQIQVALDPAARTLSAEATLTITPAKEKSVQLSLSALYRLDSVQAEGGALKFKDSGVKEGARRYEVRLPKHAGPLKLRLTWSGQPPALPADYKFNRNEVTDLPNGYLSPDGAFLPGGTWYPTIPDSPPMPFTVSAKLPGGWRLVAPGKLTRNADGTETYDSINPLEGLDIAAAPWSVMEDNVNGQRVAVYTLPGTPPELANTYLLATGDYLKRFTAEVGPHAWPQFLVVEHILPTGYGLPSMTLLGGAVMRLPFIVKTSLGHEVLHDWWGNGVYVDRSQGNWCEGLTAYMADHFFSAEENRDGGRDYRTQILRDYREYTAHGKDVAVSDFRERHDARERAIGYGKVAMIFHMLRVQLGPERFQQAVRQLFYEYKYKPASWGDIQAVFSRTAETDLSWFFKQWVSRPGAPELTVGTPRVIGNDEKSAMKVALSATPGWQLAVPLDARETNGRVFDGFGTIPATGKGEGHVVFPPGVSLGEVVVDPEVDVFRRLTAEEVPASLARYLAAPPDLIVLGTGRDGLLETARRVADKVGSGKVTVRRDLELTPEMLAAAQRVLWLGRPADTALGPLVRLPAGVVLSADRFATASGGSGEEDAAIVLALDNPKPGTGVLLVVDVLRAPQLDVVMQKITHYGKYSYLVFGAGRAQVRGVWPAPSTPLRVAM